MINNIFFDFDMTLAYRIIMWKDTVLELLLENSVVPGDINFIDFYNQKKYPWAMPELSHKQFFNGKLWWQFVEEYIFDCVSKITDSTIATKVSKGFKPKYLDLAYWRVFADSFIALDKLNCSGYNLHILSNHVPEARALIADLGFSKQFKTMTISAEVGFEKPNSKIFECALDVAGAKPENSLMVGDSFDADIVGATNMGFKAIMVRKPNLTAYPHYMANFGNLINKIKGLDDET